MAAPSAVTPLILAVKYADAPEGGEVGVGDAPVALPHHVSAAVFTSTIGSIPTLTVLLWVLQTGLVV